MSTASRLGRWVGIGTTLSVYLAVAVGLCWLATRSAKQQDRIVISEAAEAEADNNAVLLEHLKARLDILGDRVRELQRSCVRPDPDPDDAPTDRRI